jgi:hypothetical protein
MKPNIAANYRCVKGLTVYPWLISGQSAEEEGVGGHSESEKAPATGIPARVSVKRIGVPSTRTSPGNSLRRSL